MGREHEKKLTEEDARAKRFLEIKEGFDSGECYPRKKATNEISQNIIMSY